jgi:large subunit ribosomal protein L32
MPVPKRKVSKSRRDMRAANKGFDEKAFAVCQTCQAPAQAHAVCSTCGHYKGVKVIQTKHDRMRKRGEMLQARQKYSSAAPQEQITSKE